MTLKTELYSEAIKRLPSTGQVILGHQENEQIVVYQAYNQQIAEYAVKKKLSVEVTLATIGCLG